MNRVRKQVKCKDDIQRNIATEEIAVAILDTGIGRHPDFGKRILTFVDFVNGRQASYDDYTASAGSPRRDTTAVTFIIARVKTPSFTAFPTFAMNFTV